MKSWYSTWAKIRSADTSPRPRTESPRRRHPPPLPQNPSSIPFAIFASLRFVLGKPCSAFWKHGVGQGFCRSARRVSIKKLALSSDHLSWSTLMKMPSLRIVLAIAVLLCLCGPNRASPQAPFEPAQMSPRTLFYVIWRGVPGPEARKANSLLALWDDPDFAPVRSAIAANMLNSSAEKSPQRKLTSQEIEEYAALLENSFTLGYVSEATRRNLSTGAVAADARNPAWNGMFLVYDRTGSEALLSKTILRMRAEEKETPRLLPLMIGGVPVLKSESKNGVTYWAEHGKYAVIAGERSVMEEILNRLDGKVSGAASLSQSGAYQEARENLGSGLLELFLRIPELKNLAADSKAGTSQIGPLLDAARLDAVHSLSGHVTFEGSKTHVQAAILGEAVPGTPFEMWSAGQPSPASLSFVPADAVSC